MAKSRAEATQSDATRGVAGQRRPEENLINVCRNGRQSEMNKMQNRREKERASKEKERERERRKRKEKGGRGGGWLGNYVVHVKCGRA